MSLILQNCHKADEKTVRSVGCPKPDGRWHPISHGMAIDRTLSGIDRLGLEVKESRFALSGNKKQTYGNTRMFGELILGNGKHNISLPKDFTMAIGIRNSIDKSISYNICGGENVFVCGNMSFSGEFMVKRKHTINIEDQLDSMIDEAIQTYLVKFEDRISEVESWKGIEIDQRQVDHTIMSCVRSGAINKTRIDSILNEWQNPRHPEFEARNVWSLFNAFTEDHKFRRGDPNDLADYSISLNNTFRTMYSLAESN